MQSVREGWERTERGWWTSEKGGICFEIADESGPRGWYFYPKKREDGERYGPFKSLKDAIEYAQAPRGS